MRRYTLALLCALSFFLTAPRKVAAQLPTVDFTSIASDVINTIQQINEVMMLGDQIWTMSERADQVYDLVKKTQGMVKYLQDFGEIQDLLEAYASLVDATVRLTGQLDEWRAVDPGFVIQHERYINACQIQGKEVIRRLKEYIKNLKNTNKDADDARKEAQRARDSLLRTLGTLDSQARRLERETATAKDLGETMKFFSSATAPKDYTDYAKRYGTTKAMARPLVVTVNVILGLMLLFMVAYASILYFRGSGNGDVTSETVFIRLAVAVLVDCVLLICLNKFIF